MGFCRHACDVGEAAGVVCAEEGWVLPQVLPSDGFLVSDHDLPLHLVLTFAMMMIFCCQHCNEEGRLCLAGGSEPSAGKASDSLCNNCK